MDKFFVKDYSHENDIWNIYILNDTLKYLNVSNKNNVDEKKLNLPNPNNDCKNMNLSNKIVYSILNDGCIEFLNVYDNKFYQVYNIFFNYRDCPIILYYCNKDDPFVVVQTSSYMDFQNIFYVNRKEIIAISQIQNQEYYFSDILNTIIHVKKIQQTPIITNFKKYLFFGFNMNIGHHLWNEISALYYFLQNTDYHNKIDGIIIGPFDFFNMETILKEKYTFNVLKFTDMFQECRHFHYKNLTNIFPIVLNTFYIDKNIKYLLDNTINNNCKINECDMYNDNTLEITIDIRTFRRYLINQDIFYTKLIKKLLDDYKEYKIKINFLGCFKTNSNFFSKHIDNEYIEQCKIVNNIIENFNNNTNLVFKNFIGEQFFTIKNETLKSKIFIATFGTSCSNLINWIHNTKVIVFGPVECYGWSNIQYNVLKNYDVIMVPTEYITLSKGMQEPFDVNFEMFYEFLKNELCNLL